MISMYDGVKKPNPITQVPIEKVVQFLKGAKMKGKIEELRTADEKKAVDLKLALPAVTFAGTFNYRKAEGIAEYSNLAVMDFDKVECPEDLKQEISQDPHALLTFLSPSGTGVKLVLKFPGTIENYRDHYLAALDYFKKWNPDISTKDISRLTFLSWDPTLIYKPDAQTFTKKVEKIAVHYEKVEDDHRKIFENLVKWQDRKFTWTPSQRNSYLTGLSCACCRYGIPEATALFLFMQSFPLDEEYNSRRVEGYFSSAYKVCRHLFGTVQFERSGAKEVSVIKDTREVSDEPPAGIFEAPKTHNILAGDIENEIFEIYDNGYGHGLSTGIALLDNNFTLGKGRVALFGGIPQHGKSQFTKELMVLQSLLYGDIWQVYGPEDFPAADFYCELAQIASGENISPRYGKQLARDKFKQVLTWLHKHFIYVYPETEVPNPETIFRTFEENIIRYGCTGCLIDPFNQMDSDINKHGGREDLYIGAFASAYKRFGQKHNVYTWVVVHPNSDIRPAKGEIDPPMPTQFNLTGGQAWNQKVDDIVMIHRPYRESDPTNSEVWIESRKIKKQKQFGKPGKITMRYNAVSGRYYGGPLDSDYFPPFPYDDNPFNSMEAVTL